MLYQLDDRRVVAEGDCYVAPSAAVIGRVRLKHNVSVWFSAVVRGDDEPIVIGENSNIQDCVVVHTDPGHPCIIGDNVTIGHKAVVHGCVIGDNTTVGINAVVLTGARVGRNCLIGANSLVGEGKEIPDNSLVLGTPGRIIGKVTPERLESLARNYRHYVGNGRKFAAGLTVQDAVDIVRER